MLLLQIGPVDGRPMSVRRSACLMSPTTPTMVVSSFDVVAAAFGQGAAQGILRRAVEALGEGQVDDGDFGLSFRVGRREFPARQQAAGAAWQSSRA